jgi:site-specific DNA-methyltransferase (adenine-specific)
MISPQSLTADQSVNIYQGDCRQVLLQMPPEAVDLALTDPPYLVSYGGRWCSDWLPIEGDNDSSWVLPAFTEIYRVLKQDTFCFSFYGWPFADLFLQAWKQIGFRPVSHIACVKSSIGLGHYTRNQHETAYLLAKGNPILPKAALSDVFNWEREAALYHPNQKPLSVISRILAAYSSENALVLDPFMGSGTTLLAARNMGRRAIGIEIDEGYCRVAANRLAQQMLQFEPTPLLVESNQLPLAHLHGEEASDD